MRTEKQLELMRLEWGCLIVGTSVAVLGLVMVIAHFRSRGKLTDFHHSDEERQFLRARYFRRLQTSAVILGLGALIALFGRLHDLESRPVLATVYVGVMLLLCFWIMLMGLGDAFAIRLHAKRSRRSHQSMESSLQKALADAQGQADSFQDDSKGTA